MRKLIISLLSLAVLAISGVANASCTDGSEPVKSVSADGSYYVYTCGGGSNKMASWSDKTICRLAKAAPDNVEYQAESTSRGLSCGGVTSTATATISSTVNSNTKVKVAMKPFIGNWIKSDGVPNWSAHYVKWQLVFTERSKSYNAGPYAIGDFDNDGVDDLFVVTNPKQPGVTWDKVGPNCEPSVGECFSNAGAISVFKVNQIKSKLRDDVYTDAIYSADDVTGLLLDENPVEMKGILAMEIQLADFNGDGKLDIFANDTTNMTINGKSDLYFLSNEGPGWTESTATHVTGTNVQNGKGLVNFSHSGTVGDIDGDGDIDIVVTSAKWTGGNGANQNGEIWCYVNQGDGHMKVRKCGNQWGFTVALGDVDNDGDLDLVFGSKSFAYVKKWNKKDGAPGCFPGRNSCNGTFNGILLNDGNGNFYKRGFSFPDDVRNSNGFSYTGVSEVSVADLDGDGDLDVIRSHVGHNYAGAGMTIEENIGKGKFRTVLYSEFCKGPKSKAVWPKREANEYNCWVSEFKYGDFNKDGFIDIVLDGHDSNISDVVKDGAVYMSTGKFEYDIVLPSPLVYNGGQKADEDFPLIEMKLTPPKRTYATEKVTKALTAEEQAAEQLAVELELAEFEASLEN